MLKNEETLREWLQYIKDITYDREGVKTADDFGRLVDEIHLMAKAALGGKESPTAWVKKISKRAFK